MDGNICRCGTYNRIIRAIQRASRSMEKQAAAPVKRAEATTPAAAASRVR
jgi:xanthine dehydrogenase iron-sulfur cluster and FAD-binding subunit A